MSGKKKFVISAIGLISFVSGAGTSISALFVKTVDFQRLSLGLILIITGFFCVFAWMFLDMLENI